MPSVDIKTENPQPTVPTQNGTVATSAENSPFTNDQLIDAWFGLKKYFPREERLLAMISTFKPTIESEHNLKLTLASPLQKDEFNRYSAEIMGHIRKVLKNDLIRIEVEVVEHLADQRAYTALDKYKAMSKINPELVNLKKELDLQLE